MGFAIDMLRMAGKRLRGTITPQLGVQQSFTTGAAAIDLTPISCAANDVLAIAIIGPTGTSDLAPPTLSGNVTGAFAAAQADVYGNDTADSNLFVFVQPLTGADTSIDVTWTGVSSGFSQIYRMTGVDLTTPLDVAIQTANGNNTDLANPPSITPITPGAQIVAFYGGAQTSATSWGTPAGLDNFSAGVAGLIKTARGRKEWSGSGPFDPAAIPTGQNGGQCSWVAATLALRPAYI